MGLEGRIVVITGAGSGLGRALAIGLAAKGATVIGLGRHEEPLAETAARVPGGHFVARTVDVSDAEAVTRTIQEMAQRFGRIDVLVNNAAVYPKESFLEQDAQSWMQAIAINVGGVANGCRAVLPLMMERGYGRILNVGSFADRAPIPRSSAYAASKGAVRALTKAIAADLSDRYPDILCLEWIPGHLNTQMSDFTGIDPAVCVDWAAELIALPAGPPNTRIFEGNREQRPPKSLRARLKEKLFFWRRR